MYMDNYSPSHPTGEMESENECNNETNENDEKYQNERDKLEGVFKGIVSQMAETTKNEDESERVPFVEKKCKNDLSDKYIMSEKESRRERSRSNISSDQQSRPMNISGISDSEISKSSKQSFSVRNDRNQQYLLKRIRSRSKSVSDEDSILLKDNYQKSQKMQPKRICESYNKELQTTSEKNCRNENNKSNSSKKFPQKFKDNDISNKLTLLKSNKVWEFSSDEESNTKAYESNRKIHQNFDRQSLSKRKSYSMGTHSFRDDYDLGFVNRNVSDTGKRDERTNINDYMTYIFSKYSEAFDVDEDFALSDEIDKIIRSPIMQSKHRIGSLKGFESDSDWGMKLNEFQRIAKYISLEELASTSLESNYADFDLEQYVRDKVFDKDMIYNPRVNNIGMDANEEIVSILNKQSKKYNYDEFLFDDRRNVDIRTLSRQDKQNEYSFKRFQNDFLLRQQDTDDFNQRSTKSITLEQKRQYPVNKDWIYDRKNLELERCIKEKYGSLNLRNNVKDIVGINVNERESSIVNRNSEPLVPNAECRFWKTKYDDNETLIKQDENIQHSFDRFHSEFQSEQNFDKFNQRNIKSYTQKLYKSESSNYNRTNSAFKRHINEKFDDSNIVENMIGKDINERMASVHNSSEVREADEEFSYRRNYNEISMIPNKYNKNSPERFQNNFEWEQNLDGNFKQRIVRNITREQEWDLPMTKTFEYGLTNFERNINENFSDRNQGDGIFDMNVDERVSYIENSTFEPREVNEKLILWNKKYNDNKSSIIQDENTKLEISDKKNNENKLRQKSSVQPILVENFESDLVDRKEVQNIEVSNLSENYLNESHKELYNLELGSKVSVKSPIANDNKLDDSLSKVDVKGYDNFRVRREGSMSSSIKGNDYINQTNERNMSYQPGHRPSFQNKNNSSNIDFEQKYNDPINITNSTLQNPLIKDKCFNSYQDNFSENGVNYYDATILPQKSNFEDRIDTRDIKVSNISETISNNLENESYKGLSNFENLSKGNENFSIVKSNNLNEFITKVTVGNLDNQFDALVSNGNISSSWKENDLPFEINKVNLLYQSEEPLSFQNRDYYYNFPNNNFSNNINFEKGYNNTTDFKIDRFQRQQIQDQSFNNYQNNNLSENYNVNYNNESLYLNNFMPQQVRPPYTYSHNNFMPSQQMPNIVFPRVCGQLPFPLNTSIRPPIPMIPQLQHPIMPHMIFIPPPPPTEDPLPPQPPTPSAEEPETIINEKEKYVEQLPNISQPLNNIAQSLSMMDNKNLLETLLTQPGLSGDKLRLAQEKKQDLSSRLDGDTFSNIVKSAATSVISRLVESSVKAPPISDNMSMSPPSPPSSSPFQESSNDLNIKKSQFVTPPLSNCSDNLKPLHMSSNLEDVTDNETKMLRSYFECKNDWQERIALEVKTFLKPAFLSKTINKNDYKEIMKRCVTKITRCGVTEINKDKIEKFVLSYVNKYNKIHNTKQSVAVSSSEHDS